MKLIVIGIFLLSLKLGAHGDHSAPGAIPPSPNGGVLSEAKHVHKGSHKHNHGAASEIEIFFEAKLKGKILTIFPLELDHKTGNVFKALNAEDFSDLKVKLIDPRKKSKLRFNFQAEKQHWSLSLDSSRARRLMVELSGIYKGAKYIATVQVEKK